MEVKKASIQFKNDIAMKTIHVHNKHYENFVSVKKKWLDEQKQWLKIQKVTRNQRNLVSRRLNSAIFSAYCDTIMFQIFS